MKAQRQALLKDDNQPERRPPFDVGGLLAQLFTPPAEPEAPPTPTFKEPQAGWLNLMESLAPFRAAPPTPKLEEEWGPVGRETDNLGDWLGARLEGVNESQRRTSVQAKRADPELAALTEAATSAELGGMNILDNLLLVAGVVPEASGMKSLQVGAKAAKPKVPKSVSESGGAKAPKPAPVRQMTWDEVGKVPHITDANGQDMMWSKLADAQAASARYKAQKGGQSLEVVKLTGTDNPGYVLVSKQKPAPPSVEPSAPKPAAAAPPVKPPVEPPTAVGQPEPFQPPMTEDLLKRINIEKGKASRQEMLREGAEASSGSQVRTPAEMSFDEFKAYRIPWENMPEGANKEVLAVRGWINARDKAVRSIRDELSALDAQIAEAEDAYRRGTTGKWARVGDELEAQRSKVMGRYNDELYRSYQKLGGKEQLTGKSIVEPAAVEPGSLPVAPEGAAGGLPPAKPPAPPTGGMAAEPQGNILGLRPIVPGQESAVEGMLNSVRRMFKGKGDIVPTHPAAEAALTERKRIAPIIDSMATDFAEDTRLAASTFDRDKKGLIPSLAGLDPEIPSAPTIQHVAARFPLYEGRLNPDQLAAMQRLRETSTGYERMLRELEVEFGKRPDIIEGGFYLPRGNALKEGAEESVKVYAGRGGKGKGGYRKASEFVTQPEGVAAGYEYTDVVDAVQGTARKMGRDALDAHVAKYFKNLRDESGALMGETPADRIVPSLREKVEGLREKIAGRMQTLRNQTVRGKAQMAETGRREVDMERQAVQGEAAVGRWSPEKEAHLATGAFSADTEASLKTTRTVLDTLVKEENYAWSQLTQAQKRSSGTLAKRESTMDAIQGFRDELDSLRSEWEAAKTKSRNTPRTQNVIGLPGLEQWTFPDELANAMNSVIKHERIGEGSLATQSINFVNNSYRQLRATLDNSAQGIQALLAWGSNPQAAMAASKVNLKAWWLGGDKVLAKWLRDFDGRMAAEDMPKIQDWIRSGSQLGGLSSEWTSPVWQKIPVVKQANRSFAAMGDSLRGEWNYNLLKEEMKRSGLGWRELQAQGKLDEIAAITNKMTGWTRKSGNALIQELGELALFAPKFFKARIETVVNGVAGLRPGATMQQRIARQSLLKTIGLATILTTAINYARGKETDYSPLKNGQWNPNFMRIRDVFGRDIALLGTYDSLARAMVLTAQGKPHEALRGLSSGLLSMAWDLISNEDFTGQRTRSDPATFAAWLSKEMVPFSWQEAPEHLGKVGQGLATSKPELVAAGAGAIGGEFLGIKSAALSKTDQLDTEAKKSYGKDWGELTAQQQYDLRKKNPQIAKIELEARSKRPLPDTPGFQAMSKVQDRLPEKVKTELKRRGATIGSINRTISWGPKGKMVDYNLKDDEYKLYQELMGKQLMTKLAGVTDKTSDAILKKRIGDARAMALRQLRARLKLPASSSASAPRPRTFDFNQAFGLSNRQQPNDILSAFLNR